MQRTIPLLFLLLLSLVIGPASAPAHTIYWPLVLHDPPPRPELTLPTPAIPPLATLINAWRIERGLQRLWPETRLHEAAGIVLAQAVVAGCDPWPAEAWFQYALHVVGYRFSRGWGRVVCQAPDNHAAWLDLLRFGPPADPLLEDLGIQQAGDTWVILAATERD